ncbi:MAG: DMT family transporter [Clostridiales bacterium]|nr:DMT family transporter [Clostridiales bacterium]MDY2872636.1 DMT family transporter [Eubacteriales bacterium]
MTVRQGRGVLCAVLAAAFYALNAPLSKLLLGRVAPAMMAAFLYLGAGLGMCLWLFVTRKSRARTEQPLTRRDLPYTVGMIVLDVAAPIALMTGVARTSAASASLLNNFEIVATSLIALILFKEAISKRLWLGIFLVTLSSVLLSAQDIRAVSLSAGSLYVLLACVCWGFENNCTRRLSEKDPMEIVAVKGIFSGLGALIVAFVCGAALPDALSIVLALLLGFVAYGLSILFYIYAQRSLGAAKTSAYYAVAPFIGVALSLALFREIPSGWFIAALIVMIAGTWCVTTAESPA